MNRKFLSDNDLEKFGSLYSTMLLSSAEAWELAMRTMKIESRYYKGVCNSGKYIQKIYIALEFEAYERGWERERVQKYFTVLGSYSFG